MAGIALISLSAAGSNWTSMWQGFDQLLMSVDEVDFDEDAQVITVTNTFVNDSDQQLLIYELMNGVTLSGRSIGSGTERLQRTVLQPGDSITLSTQQNVPGEESSYLADALASDARSWNVQGRIQISVDGMGDPVWMPFSRNLAVR